MARKNEKKQRISALAHELRFGPLKDYKLCVEFGAGRSCCAAEASFLPAEKEVQLYYTRTLDTIMSTARDGGEITDAARQRIVQGLSPGYGGGLPIRTSWLDFRHRPNGTELKFLEARGELASKGRLFGAEYALGNPELLVAFPEFPALLWQKIRLYHGGFLADVAAGLPVPHFITGVDLDKWMQVDVASVLAPVVCAFHQALETEDSAQPLLWHWLSSDSTSDGTRIPTRAFDYLLELREFLELWDDANSQTSVVVSVFERLLRAVPEPLAEKLAA